MINTLMFWFLIYLAVSSEFDMHLMDAMTAYLYGSIYILIFTRKFSKDMLESFKIQSIIICV